MPGHSTARAPRTLRSLVWSRRYTLTKRCVQRPKNQLPTACTSIYKWQNPFSEAYVRQLHLRMFDQAWKWAGAYRTTEKNIGIPHYQIREALPALLGDAGYWVEHRTFEPDELAVRFHHKLVWIHPFANGNGRLLGSWQMSSCGN